MTYTPPTISGYNSSPPPDDGSQVTANKILWSTIKTKLADPIKNYVDSINTAVANGFTATFLGDVVNKSGNFTVGTTDDGVFFDCTSALTATLPPAVDAGEGFKICLFNNMSSGAVTADGDSGETVNGATTQSVSKQYDAMILICTGTGWYSLKISPFSLASSAIASATTTDLGTLSSNNALISGTTTITSFGSSALTANPIYFIRFSGILTLTHNGTSLIIPGAGNVTTAAGDSALVEYLGSGNWRVLEYSKASGKPLLLIDPSADFDTTHNVPLVNMPVGSVGQRSRVTAFTGAITTVTAAIPSDNTTPLIGEGTELFTATITPSSATSRVRVSGVLFGSASTTMQIILAAFRGSTNIGSTLQFRGQENGMYFEFEDAPAVTTATTYSLRGGVTAGTLTLNQVNGVTLGGSLISYMLVEELKG